MVSYAKLKVKRIVDFSKNLLKFENYKRLKICFLPTKRTLINDNC